MSNSPDFCCHNYQIEKELGHNRAGGRVTYLATDIRTGQAVVIKQFQFAKSSSSWQNYDAYHREIQVLKQLDHPGIPKYLDGFQTEDGFCMVQEYKNAESLAVSRSFSQDKVRQIAIAALKILIYLQNQLPPVIHRDIKPANILSDDEGNVYLVDFGFARVGEGEVGVSSVVKGTLGFMPPEQLFNRQLTEASDLYGLGMTLICLLTGTKAEQIGELVDITYRVSFRHLVPRLNVHWLNWLEKMVEPRLKDRYSNAVEALAALPSSPLRPPDAHFSQAHLEFKARTVGELLTQVVTITNPVPETLLEGRWEVAFHAHDPASEVYRWIEVTPSEFRVNQVRCEVTVDTRRLIAGKIYTRRLLLHTNTLAKTYPLSLHIKIASSSIRSSVLPYGILLALTIISLGISWSTCWLFLVIKAVAEAVGRESLWVWVGAAIGLNLSAWLLRASAWRSGSAASFLAAICVILVVFAQVLTEDAANVGFGLIVTELAIGMGGGALSGVALGTVAERMIVNGVREWLAISLVLVTSMMGATLGAALIVGFFNPLVLTTLTASSFTLIGLGGHLALRLLNTRLSLHKAERFLIKP